MRILQLELFGFDHGVAIDRQLVSRVRAAVPVSATLALARARALAPALARTLRPDPNQASVADAARAVLACGADFDACVSEIRTRRDLPSEAATAVVASAEGLALHLSDSRRTG